MEKPRRYLHKLRVSPFYLGVKMDQKKEFNTCKLENIELNELKNDKLFAGSFKAYFSTFNTVNLRPDKMMPNCFDKEIARFEAGDKMPRLIDEHWGPVVGVVNKIYKDEVGAIVEGSFTNSTAGKDMYINVKSGAINELSFSFYVTKYEIENDVRNILEVSGIDEISFVKWGMDPLTHPTEVNSDLTIRKAEQALKQAGFKNAEAKKILSKGFNALTRDDSEQNREDSKNLELEAMLILQNLNFKLRKAI